MFNDAKWASVLEKTYGFQPRQEGPLLLFKTRRGLEMNPLGDYLSEDTLADFKTSTVLLRLDRPQKSPDFKPQFVTYRLKTTHPYEEILQQKIHPEVRNKIAKAKRHDVDTQIHTDQASLKAFYPLYVRSLLKIGALPHPYGLFSHSLQEFPGRFFIFLSTKETNVLAGIIALLDPKARRLHIWSNGQAKSARFCAANVACYAEVLRYAATNPNIDEVDFGNSAANSSLAFFKSRFGGEAIVIWSNEKVENHQGGLEKLAIKTLTLLPPSLVSLCSSLIFKNLR